MFLSMWTGYFADLTLVDALKKLAGAGFKYAELASLAYFQKGPKNNEKIYKIKNLCDKLGIKLHQVHGHFGTYIEKSTCAWEKRFAVCKEEIKISSNLGIGIIVSHPLCLERDINPKQRNSVDYYQYLMKENISFYKKLIPLLEKYNVKIAIENMLSSFNCFYSAEELLEIIDSLKSEHFGICMDTSHLQGSGQNLSRFILKAGKQLIATHISDNLAGKNLDLHLMPAFANNNDGWVDWFPVREALEKSGYNGSFNLEIPGEGMICTPLVIRERKVKYAYEYLTEFLEHKF